MKLSKKEEAELDLATPWENWIIRQNYSNRGLVFGKKTQYDMIVDLAISSYTLNERTRKSDHLDRKHFFYLWWYANKGKMSSYNTLAHIADVIGEDHSNVIHYVGTNGTNGKRKKTGKFNENTSCIKDFLES